MDLSLIGISKLLQDIEERNQKYKQKKKNKKVGYAPKCTVCNNPKLDEIEKLREENYTLQEIKDNLQLDCSIMALSRHFKNHYPNSQEYKQKQQIEMLENIKEAYTKYPFLEEFFKDKDLQYLEDFNTDCGFCTDSFNLCNYIPASTVSNGNDNIFYILENEINEIQEDRLNLIEKIITYNFLNIAPEDKEIYFNLLNFNGSKEEFIETLQAGKELKQ